LIGGFAPPDRPSREIAVVLKIANAGENTTCVRMSPFVPAIRSVINDSRSADLQIRASNEPTQQ
jgi:hypothetical protein